ncbi:MAG TPA: PVC-type heme-binding CxxCH protein, partial [Verrucomicrobiae bacterium]|nr:PVC-type heme-binding CxxCH protein [Verrucomicrobiae bacterium]
MLNFRLASMALAFSLASSFSSRARDQDRAPAAVAAESSAPHHFSPAPEALAALKGFQIPAGLHADLWASEPMLKNPVAFNFDDQGRVYVCETYRLFHGVDDIRRIMGWLDEELAARTVDDRLAEMKRHLGSQFHTYTEASEKIRLLEDRAGAGRADSSKIFAEGFNSALDGIAAGVLPRDGKVWYTDIPNLWLLRDTNHDGVADSRESLHYGFGVRVGFLGHDLHGLAFGPDGKIYFSIGDRGSNIRITAGKTVGEPDCGSVFRCNPDGSDFEIFAYGLRNPQDLVFDAYGNLFTGDNNSDSGDQARWVYVVEGADNGWRVGYQFMESPYSRGPFNQEKLWYPPFDGQAAYIVPPIANIASGPSGVAYFPGTGLPEKYRDHFFLVDFRGGAANSGIHTFTLKAKGAGFELVNPSHFIWNTLATDVKFSPKGGLYWSDWIDGWGMPDKGRIYRVFDPETQASQLVRETARLLTEGMRHRSARELRSLLEHPDMRVRQNAQFELASHGAPALPDFEHVLQKSSNRFARLHAIWGIGQVLSSHVGAAGKPAVDLLTRALKDRDSEVRGQAAKVLGDCRIKSSSPMLVQSLEDPAPRVRFFSAISIGKVAGPEAIAPVLEMLRENHDQDPWLRHAGVMALTGIRDVDALLASANDPSPSVRMGVLLALRRLQRPEITRFLADKDQRIVLETARAINDEPINGAMPELAALISKPAFATSGEPLIRRVLNANFRFGTPDTARALAAFAGLKAASAPMRVEALEELADWEHPSGRDRVVGLWRPIPATRAAETSAAALSPWFDRITASGTPDTVRIAAIHAAGKLKITS